MNTETPLSNLTPAELAAMTAKFSAADQSRLDEFVKEKRAAGLPKDLAEECARRQLVKDKHPERDVPIR